MAEDNILREVDEELRSERMRNLWRRFGPYVIGAAVAVVVVVAVNEGWSWWQRTNAARSSELFYTAIEHAEAGDVAAAQSALGEVKQEGSGKYPVLAEFREAALLAETGQTEEAVAAYDALSTSLSNQRLRDLSLLLSAYLLVDQGNVSAVESRIGGLIAPDNPMRSSAREILGLTQYAAGDLDAARATFERMTADSAGSSQAIQRVRIYVAQLVAQGAAAPESQTADEAAEASGTSGAEQSSTATAGE